MPSDDDENLFLQALSDVKPLQFEKRVVLKSDEPSELVVNARRKAATQKTEQDSNHLASDYVELLDPHYFLEFKRSGVQHGVFKKLKQGRYPAEARLDLHRMVVDKARQEVFAFIKESAKYDLRSLIIVHGKGSHGNTGSALLKSYVNKWLPEMDEVQAFSSAQPHHGGLGAVYVLLGKSEKKKQENRDKISRGRTEGS